MRLLLIGLLLHVISTTALACDKCDVVVDVIDGDTVIILCEGEKRPVHLVSIDAPQLEQPYGDKAREFTKKLLLNHVVTIDYADRSRANDITSADGKSLKWGLVRAGLAWYPDNHKSNTLRDLSDKLGKYERKARRARKGLWAQDNPKPPWSLHHGSEAMPEIMAKLGNRAYGKAKIPNGVRVVG